jgi:20S proteasome subunit alpha 7
LEYAQKAIESGETMVGLACSDGVILATEKIIGSKLQAKSSDRRIFSVDEHIGVGICGKITDGMIVVQRARIECENYR